MTGRRVWLADLLGPLRYLGSCASCRRQFLSANVYVWITPFQSMLCDWCGREGR